MEKQSEIHVLLVDDHPIVRAGLRSVTEVDSRLRVVAEARSATETVEMARIHLPDLILLDIRLGDSSGIDACRNVKAELPHTKILFVTSYADNDLVLAAMAAGADGYLLKENDAHQIVQAMHVILGGGAVFDPVVKKQLTANTRSGVDANPLKALTGQELRVLANVATGKTDKEVAAEMQLRAKTIRNYLDNVFQKLHVNTRTQAAMIYAKWSSE